MTIIEFIKQQINESLKNYSYKYEDNPRFDGVSEEFLKKINTPMDKNASLTQSSQRHRLIVRYHTRVYYECSERNPNEYPKLKNAMLENIKNSIYDDYHIE